MAMKSVNQGRLRAAELPTGSTGSDLSRMAYQRMLDSAVDYAKRESIPEALPFFANASDFAAKNRLGSELVEAPWLLACQMLGNRARAIEDAKRELVMPEGIALEQRAEYVRKMMAAKREAAVAGTLEDALVLLRKRLEIEQRRNYGAEATTATTEHITRVAKQIYDSQIAEAEKRLSGPPYAIAVRDSRVAKILNAPLLPKQINVLTPSQIFMEALNFFAKAEKTARANNLSGELEHIAREKAEEAKRRWMDGAITQKEKMKCKEMVTPDQLLSGSRGLA